MEFIQTDAIAGCHGYTMIALDTLVLYFETCGFCVRFLPVESNLSNIIIYAVMKGCFVTISVQIMAFRCELLLPKVMQVMTSLAHVVERKCILIAHPIHMPHHIRTC